MWRSQPVVQELLKEIRVPDLMAEESPQRTASASPAPPAASRSVDFRPPCGDFFVHPGLGGRAVHPVRDSDAAAPHPLNPRGRRTAPPITPIPPIDKHSVDNNKPNEGTPPGCCR